MYQKIFSRLFAKALPIAAVFTVFACTTQEPDAPAAQAVRIAASVAGQSATRAYQDKGPVKEGIYYLTYPKSTTDLEYTVAEVNFHDGTGFVTVADGGELTWNDVGLTPGSQTQATFYLDNVPVGEQPQSPLQIVELTGDNRYSAALFDYEEGSNDLLWGSSTVARTVMNVPVQLRHCMSMVNVEITVDASKEGSLDMDLSNATVEITSVIHDAQSYNRLTGGLELGENPQREQLTLVQPDVVGWKSTEQVNDDERIKLYTSHDYVLPPQDLLTTVERSRLRISVPQGDGQPPRIFSGVIPKAMTVQYEDGSSAPVNLAFIRGHILTLRVVMNPDQMILEFLPVTVVDWLYQGSHSLSGSEAGLYNADNINGLIEAIQNRDESLIGKYGYKDEDGTWVLSIFVGLTLNYEEIAGMLADSGVNYRFAFNGKSVTVQMPDGKDLILDGNGGEQTLKDILDGKYTN